MSIRSYINRLFSRKPEVKPEVSQPSVEKPKEQPQQVAVKVATLGDLQSTVESSQKDKPKDRLTRIHDAARRRLLGRTSSRLNNPDGTNENPDLTLQEAADYITEAGGRIEAKKDGAFSVSLNTSKLPRGENNDQRIGFMDLMPPVREFSLKIQKPKQDGTPGEETFNQRVKNQSYKRRKNGMFLSRSIRQRCCFRYFKT